MQNENKGYAGNLLEEIEEIEKIVMPDEAIEISNSYTIGCGTFFTLYCC